MLRKLLVHITILLMVFSIIITPENAFAQLDTPKENENSDSYFEVIVPNAEIIDKDSNVVGVLVEGAKLGFIENENGQVYINWNQELASINEKQVKIVEDSEEPTEEPTYIPYDGSLDVIGEINTNTNVDVYVDENKTEVLLNMESDINYYFLDYSTDFYKILIGDRLVFIDAAKVTKNISFEDISENDKEEPEVNVGDDEEKEEKDKVGADEELQPIEKNTVTSISAKMEISAQSALIQEVIAANSIYGHGQVF